MIQTPIAENIAHPSSSADLLDFHLPPEQEAAQPPEVRGHGRDDVRMLVSYRSSKVIRHLTFADLPDLLDPGDVVVINTSGTLNAALPGTLEGQDIEVHLSTRLPGGLWSAELRRMAGHSTEPLRDAIAGQSAQVAAGGLVRLLAPYRSACGCVSEATRLWIVDLQFPLPTEEFLVRHAIPIRYGYVKDEWPISYYQTVYATEVGSAEMPSAGRPFTPELLTQLVARGIQVTPLLLHTGVASPEAHEPPYEEFYRVPLETADVVNTAQRRGRRVIAVGTTVVRALESVAEPDGVVHAGEGWTCLVVTPDRGVRTVDGLLTGLHEPRSSHLAMLSALAGREHLRQAYGAALSGRYFWHEFGDVHLILP